MNDFKKMFGMGDDDDFLKSAILEGLMRDHANHGASLSDLFQGNPDKKDKRAILFERAGVLKDPENFIMESQLSAKKLEIMNLRKAICDSFGMVKDLHAEVARLDKKGDELASVKAEQGLELQRLKRDTVRFERHNESLQGAVNSLRDENDSKRDKISLLMDVLHTINAIDTGATKPDLKQAVENLQRIVADISKSNDDITEAVCGNGDASKKEASAATTA